MRYHLSGWSETDINTHNIINEFLSKNLNAKKAISEGENWENFSQDLIELSKQFPEVLFSFIIKNEGTYLFRYGTEG